MVIIIANNFLSELFFQHIILGRLQMVILFLLGNNLAFGQFLLQFLEREEDLYCRPLIWSWRRDRYRPAMLLNDDFR